MADALVRAASGSLPERPASAAYADPAALPVAQAYFSKEVKPGVSVRDHLTELIHKLLLSKDADALEKLESLSLELKKTKVGAPEKAMVRATSAAAAPAVSHRCLAPPLTLCVTAASATARSERALTLALRGVASSQAHPKAMPANAVMTQPSFGGAVMVPSAPWHKDSKKLFDLEPESVPTSYLAELPSQMPMFEFAGVGLSKEETYTIYLRMLQLQKEHKLLAVRFFGKILGTQRDYLVIEARAPAELHKKPAVPEKPDKSYVPPEAPGTGLNTFCYFVAHSAARGWSQLEDVTPEAVVAARGIRKYFTGDLEAPVYCYPAFPGKEASYLRAQIARIAAATVVFPSGKFGFNEEVETTPKPIIDNPDYAVPDDLTAAESWVHAYGKVLKIGRTTNPPKPEPVEGEEEAPEGEEETPALENIGADATVMTFSEDGEYNGGNPALGAWTIKEYNTAYPAYKVAVAKSNLWPGAYAAIAKSGDKHASIYLGYGHKNDGKPFTPKASPPVLPESKEVEEAEEAALAAENALLKQIDEAKNVASNSAGDAPEE